MRRMKELEEEEEESHIRTDKKGIMRKQLQMIRYLASGEEARGKGGWRGWGEGSFLSLKI